MWSKFVCLTLASVVAGWMCAVSCPALENGAVGPKAQQAAKQQRLRVTVSREVTVVVEPLRPDGYVDYVAALNQQYRAGVTVENNAAVLLLKAFGPSQIPASARAPFFALLGIDPLPEKGDYIIRSNEFQQQLARQTVGGGAKPEEPDAASRFSDDLGKATRRPWSKQELPEIARWLELNEGRLRLLTEAVGRDRYYTPMVTGADEKTTGMLIAVLLPILQDCREAARLLAARAMLQLGSGQAEKAWSDLLACHRLSRLCGQDPTLIGALVSIAIDSVACSGDTALIQYGNLRPEQTRRVLADLQALGPLPSIAGKIEIAERYMFLDSVCAIARGDTGVMDLAGEGSRSGVERFLSNAAGAMIDWDRILRIGNSYYDRIVAAMNQPTHAERVRAIQSLEREIESIAASVRDPWKIAGSFLQGRAAVSDNMANVLVALLLPAVTAARKAEDRGNTQFQLTQVGFALAAYRSDHQTYPDRLAQLLPQYISQLPVDLFTDKEFQYRREQDGFTVYSLGPNREDNQGKVEHLDRDTAPPGTVTSGWDDFRIRVPIKTD